MSTVNGTTVCDVCTGNKVSSDGSGKDCTGTSTISNCRYTYANFTNNGGNGGNGTDPTSSNGTDPTSSNGTDPTSSNGTDPTSSNGTDPNNTVTLFFSRRMLQGSNNTTNNTYQCLSCNTGYALNSMGTDCIKIATGGPGCNYVDANGACDFSNPSVPHCNWYDNYYETEPGKCAQVQSGSILSVVVTLFAMIFAMN
jgi:hypothetical protein